MIVLTTPTGHIGHYVVQNLLDAGEALRVIVRDPAKLTQTVRERVEVARSDQVFGSVIIDLFGTGQDTVPERLGGGVGETRFNFGTP